MLTDLSFLNTNNSWPPESERPRLRLYETNRKIFEGEHAEVYADQFKRIQRVIGNFEDVVSYCVIANFQKLLSLKVADLLLGEEPLIKAGEANSKEQAAVDKVKENSDLTNTCYETAIDVSRYGDGLFYVYKDKDTGSGTIDVTQPSIWFPVVSPDNLKKIQFHVLAWTFSQGENKYLKCHIHERGKYEERVYLLEGNVIGRLVSSNVIQTGLKDFAIIQVPNVLTSDRVNGMDDYNDIDSVLSEIEVRISQIAKVLDKHAEPSVEGPSSALRQDPETGEWKLKMGNFFNRDSNDDPETKYIVWDAQMEANFKYIEKLINILAVISEMGAVLFNDMNDKTGNVPSGSALRRMMINPLAKVNRIRMRFDPAIKKAIKLCSQLGGIDIIDLTSTPISITWKDGLPGDPVEEADIIEKRTGSKATMSVRRALQTYDQLSVDDADTEIAAIDEDENKNNPLRANNFPFSEGNGGGNNGG